MKRTSHQNNRILVWILSVVVVACTTMALVLPAMTLEKDTAAQQGGIDVPNAAAGEDTVASGKDSAAPADGDEAQDEKASPDKTGKSDLSDPEPMLAMTEPGELTFEGDGFTVSATYDAKAGLPLHTELTAEEIGEDSEDYEALKDQALEAVREEANAADQESAGQETANQETAAPRLVCLYDISLTSDGRAVEPEAPVDVVISYNKALKISDAQNLRIVHFAADKKGDIRPEVLDAEDVEIKLEENGESDSARMTGASFVASGFSAYAIVEGPEALPIGWHKISSIDELIAMGGSQGVYIGHPDGYYYGNALVSDGSRTGISKTKPAQTYPPTDKAALYYFEPVEGSGNQVYAYCYAADGTTKQYVYNGGNNSLSFAADASDKTAFTVTQNSNGTFKLNNGAWYWNMQGGANGTRFCSYNNAGDGNNNVNIWYFVDVDSDPYELDGQTYGLMNWNGGVAGKALMASSSNENALDAKSLTVMSTTNNSSQLFVPNDSDIPMWTFHWITGDEYYLSAVADGSTKFLKIDADGLSLVSEQENASRIQVIPGSGAHSGQICLKSGNATLTFSGKVNDGFSVGGSVGNEWLNFVELSELTTDYFLTYSARKVSVSDESITNGSRVIVYTRSWNEAKLKYDYYAISADGTLVQVYESGDSIEWVSGQINTLLWNFVEYYWEGTNDPNFYYELYNQYSEKYIAPQVTGNQVLSDDTIGINLNGRRDGKYYSTILAWDEDDYSYVGLKVENGQIVTCPKSEAMDFYFAIMQDLNVDDDLTTVPTVDHTQYGITMKIKDFGTRAEMSNFLGNDEGGATLNLQQGLLSTNLTDGYPAAQGGSLNNLFSGAQEVNHLFIQSTYGETGYFSYDSAQNFASLKGQTWGDFTVYKELGSYDSGGNKNTLKHGQFFPFNDLKAGTFASVNGKNIYSSTGAQLPNGDARKYEELYSVEYDNVKVNPYFGVELEASFTQTPSGLDAWGHDIIFEFTGDDDFWLYVDGELIIDLGGIHSAVPGSVNFRTGDVNVNSRWTTLRALFESNYRTRNPGASDEDVAAFLSQHFDEGSTVFRDDTTHTMNIFYMERGAGASNLNMRFNLAAVKKGTVQLSKKLSGVDEDNIMADFPYQIWYKKADEETGEETEYRLTNAIPGSAAQNDDYVFYKDTVNPVKYQPSVTIDGVTYEDVFFLKPGETADINFPEGMTSYRIVECGVNTEVYDKVTVNGEEISGSPDSESRRHQDFGIDYDTTDARPKVNYDNAVNPEVLRTLTIQKKLYAEDGITPISSDEDNTEFTFRLYLASEYDELDVANMQPYHVKDPNGYYCRWDAANQKFVKIGDGIRDYSELSEAQKASATFTTSSYGSIGRIRAGYTVEIRDVLAGTQYRVEERPGEIPDGYSFQKYDGYDGVNAAVVERDQSGVMGVKGTVVSGRDAPVVVCNLKGWGLRVNKIWRDADYMSDRDATYFALFTKAGGSSDAGGSEPAMVLVPESVRQIPYNAKPQTMYWYYDQLPVSGTAGVEDYFIREVTISSDNPTVNSDGVVTEYGTITPIDDGKSLMLSGTQKGEDTPSRFTYTVHQVEGQISSESNVRVDTVTNDRPGIILKKQDWSGNALAGAVFTLKDSGGNVLGTFTSDENGLITTAFLSNDKNYTLTETKAPQTYYGLQEAMTISVNSSGTVTVSGADAEYYDLTQAQGTTLATLILKNRPYLFRAVKIDGDTDAPMAGVTFALHKQVTVDGVTTIDLNPMPGYESLRTIADGTIPMVDNSLPAGVYELREKSTLEGYTLLPGYIQFSISDTGAISLVEGQYPDGVTLKGPTEGNAQDADAQNENAQGDGVQTDSGALSYVLTVENSRTVEINLKKVDNNNNPLNGAKFRLCRKEESASPEAQSWVVVTEYGEIDMTKTSETKLSKLPIGLYRLTETHAPDGYVILEEHVYFRIGVDGSRKMQVTLTDEAGTGINQNENASVDGTTITVKNIPGAELPQSGGPGTTWLYIIGSILLLGCGITLVARRRMMEYVK